jgi:hypothetical protein
VQEQFAEKCPDTLVPYRSAVRRLIEKFRGTGSVFDAERSGRPSKRNGKKWVAATSAAYRDRPSTLNELKTAITVFIRNISQTDLQKVFANKIKRVQACIDARRHHFQNLL